MASIGSKHNTENLYETRNKLKTENVHVKEMNVYEMNLTERGRNTRQDKHKLQMNA